MDPCLRIPQHLIGAAVTFAVGMPTGAVAIRFRYDPVFRHGAEFVLWYRPTSDGMSESNCSIQFLWFAADNRPLTTETDPEPLDLGASGHWRPLRIEVPVPPRECEWLRFEARVSDVVYQYRSRKGGCGSTLQPSTTR